MENRKVMQFFGATVSNTLFSNMHLWHSSSPNTSNTWSTTNQKLKTNKTTYLLLYHHWTQTLFISVLHLSSLVTYFLSCIWFDMISNVFFFFFFQRCHIYLEHKFPFTQNRYGLKEYIFVNTIVSFCLRMNTE